MLPLCEALRHAWTVNDRALCFAVRGLVVATLACAIAAEAAARVVLSHGSGTYYGLLVFLPLLVAPGALVWRWPQPKYIALWSIAGWIETTIWSIVGSPYRYEATLPSWPYVSTPVWITVTLVLFAAPIIALLGWRREPPQEHALIAQRLRRVVAIVFALALIVVVVSVVIMGPNEGFAIAFYVALVIAPGAAVQRVPRQLTGWLWVVLAAPLCAFGLWLWFAFGTRTPAWEHRIVVAGIGTIYVLVMLVVPLILIATRRLPVAGSSARASYRSRNR